MRKLQIFLITLFLLSAAAFGLTLVYNTLEADTQAPVLTSDVNYIEISVSAGEEELLQGLHAQDDVDGDLTDQIQIKSVSQLTGARSAEVTYVVFDRASNAATLVREVRYTDYERPRFRLSRPLIYGLSEKVTLLDRLSATDVLDGDLTDRIQLTMLDLVGEGEESYQIRVAVSNSRGDSATLPLTVTLRNDSATAPRIRLSEYLVYTGVDEPVDLESYIVDVRDPNEAEKEIPASDVEITDDIDYTATGVYEAYYSYTGSTGQEYQVILTVVVE